MRLGSHQLVTCHHWARHLPCTHVTTRSQLSVCFPKLLSSGDLLSVPGHQSYEFGNTNEWLKWIFKNHPHTIVQVKIIILCFSFCTLFKDDEQMKLLIKSNLLKINMVTFADHWVCNWSRGAQRTHIIGVGGDHGDGVSPNGVTGLDTTVTKSQ